ncbi:MAG TPA: polysaccharide biosynthesis C-terminal domain-containing protein, partial [Opitutaceae bacterium]|nr:polysaccharide biosynthesis C-terminal domain-containing protein [Opitutaceae bacterium]
QSLERALFVAGLGIGLFFALGDTFIRLWTHNRLWLSPSMAISISAITVTTSLVMAGEYLLTGLNRHRNAAVAEIANGVLGLGMVVLFVRWLGLGAVGAGVVGAAAVTSIWVVRREIRRQLGGACFPGVVFALKLGLAVAAGLAAAVVARLGGGREPLPAIVHLLFAGTVGAAAYLTAAFTLKLVATGEAIALGQRFKQRFLTAPAKSV